MTKNESISITNSIITGTLGFILFMILGRTFDVEMMKVTIITGFLLYPIGLFITNVFLKFNITGLLKGFFIGGLMSIAGTIIAFIPPLVIVSYLEFLKTGIGIGQLDMMTIQIMLLVYGFVFFVAFLIGAISGLVITIIRRKELAK